MKFCKSCNKIKNNFCKDSKSKDGLQSYCKDCKNQNKKNPRKERISKFEQLLNRLENYKKIDINYWSEMELTGYCKNIFSLKIIEVCEDDEKSYKNQSTPSHHPEVKIIEKLIKNNNYNIILVKEYIDWFKTTKRSKLNTLKTLLREEYFKQFEERKINIIKYGSENLDRTTNLPENIKSLSKYIPKSISLETYGDLAFIYNVPEYYILVDKFIPNHIKDILPTISN